MIAPDLDRLIVEASSSRKAVRLEEAKRRLGLAYDEGDLGEETLIVYAGKDIALTPTAWVRMLRKARQRAFRSAKCTHGLPQ